MCHLKIFLLSFKVMDVEVFAFSECFLFFLSCISYLRSELRVLANEDDDKIFCSFQRESLAQGEFESTPLTGGKVSRKNQQLSATSLGTFLKKKWRV